MIADLIQKKQSAAADAAADQKDAIEKKNAAILAQAKDDFAKLFGDVNDEIQAIRQPGTGFNMGVDGVINSVSLIVQSDELSLSPMSFDWSPSGKIYCKVKDGNGNSVKSFDFSYPNVTLADALYCANQHFPEWKKRREEKLACIRNQRVGELLALRNWRMQDAQTANATYAQLKELDANVAENRMSQWKEDVIKEYSRCFATCTESRYRDDAFRWREYVNAANPDLARKLFAQWEKDNEKYIKQQAEKEDALYCANQHFPEWKKRREEKLACIRNQRVGELLALRNWRMQDAQTANATYAQLKELDANVAENRMSQWKEDVIKEYSRCFATCTESRYRDDAFRWREYVNAANPDLARKLFAQWEKDNEKYIKQQAEKERKQTEYAAAVEKWRADLAEWAKKEVSRLWKPFSVVRVRYSPIGYAGSDREESDAIYSVHCIGSLEEVVEAATKPGAILEAYDCGKMKLKAIGAFLDAETVATYTAEPPAIDGYVPFTREFDAGGIYRVSMPPFITEQPSGCPVRPTNPDGTSDDSDEISF